MDKLDKKIALTASLLGAVTIGIGAFAAHGLSAVVSEASLRTFETGVRYQMYHVIVLLVIAFALPLSANLKKRVFIFFIIGILLFSGSIYVLALKDVLPFGVGFLGPITPLGGLSFITGWMLLAYGIFKLKS